MKRTVQQVKRKFYSDVIRRAFSRVVLHHGVIDRTEEYVCNKYEKSYIRTDVPLDAVINRYQYARLGKKVIQQKIGEHKKFLIRKSSEIISAYPPLRAYSI